MAYFHVPVMLTEVLKYLNPRNGGRFIDCTLGGAGYTMALAEKVGESGKILGIDLDELALKNAAWEIKTRQLNNIVLVQDNFKNLKEIVAANFSAAAKFDGVVFDLGLSSAQLDDETRGFSFKGERPLDMAFGPAAGHSTEEIVNRYPLLELTRIFREYGEERRAYQIAKAIVEARRTKRISTTADLTGIVEKIVPFRFHSKIHPATRIFQALRMETNGELEVLAEVLPVAVDLLKPQGRLVVVSFHSGEDRIVKRFFKAQENLQILTKRPLIPAAAETANNFRARSAKLRAAAKIG
jgi:16S rRNA (cytosine1402-N4)-methyltransferase